MPRWGQGNRDPGAHPEGESLPGEVPKPDKPTPPCHKQGSRLSSSPCQQFLRPPFATGASPSLFASSTELLSLPGSCCPLQSPAARNPRRETGSRACTSLQATATRPLASPGGCQSSCHQRCPPTKMSPRSACKREAACKAGFAARCSAPGRSVSSREWDLGRVHLSKQLRSLQQQGRSGWEA